MCQQKLVRPSPVEQTLVPKADAGPAQQNATPSALARVTPRATFLLRKRPKSASHHWITGKCNSFRIGRETCVNRSWSAPPGAQVSLGPSQGHPLGPSQPRVTPRANSPLCKRPKSASHHCTTGKCNSFFPDREGTCANRSWSAPPGAHVSPVEKTLDFTCSQGGRWAGPAWSQSQGHAQGHFPCAQKAKVRLASPHYPPLTPSSLTVRRPAVRPFSLTYRFLPTS